MVTQTKQAVIQSVNDKIKVRPNVSTTSLWITYKDISSIFAYHSKNPINQMCGEAENEDDEDESEDEGNDAKLEFVSRQTRRGHMVAPPMVPVNEGDMTLIKPYGYR
jgi:hypothetical protein